MLLLHFENRILLQLLIGFFLARGLGSLLIGAEKLLKQKNQKLFLAADAVHQHLATHALVPHLGQLATLDLLVSPVGLRVVRLFLKYIFTTDVHRVEQ